MRPYIDFRQAFMKSSEKVLKFPVSRREKQPKEHVAFLPAALEIVETPPSPVGRAIALTIATVFCAAFAWSLFGTVDIVATAPGKIIPGGGTKTIQPFDAGVVRAIHVRDGQQVKTGELLVELDPTISAADLSHIKTDLTAAQLDAARLRAAIAGGNDPLSSFKPPIGASPELVDVYRHYLVSQTTEEDAKIAAIERELAQKRAERTTINANIQKLNATIPLLKDRVDVREQLYHRELGSKLLYLTELQDLVGQQHDLLIQSSKIQEADAAIAALVQTEKKTTAEYNRSLYDDLAKAEQKVSGLTQDLDKAERKASLQRLTSPVDGVVQQLAIHTIGGVVTPAQPLMVIVPNSSHLEIEAKVQNKDIGFIEVGQKTSIKVATFNFTRYGLLHGTVLSVSHDAIAPTQMPSDPSKPAGLGSADLSDQNPVYSARISLDHTAMRIDKRVVDLAPGMAVTVEIRTGSRRIISYLLSPLARYAHDSMRER